MLGITELGYVRFGVSDLPAWRELTTDILALEIADESDAHINLRTDTWHHRITLEASGEDDLIGAGLRVAGVEEFAEIQERLTTAGVAFEQGSTELAAQRRVLDVMTLKDPGAIRWRFSTGRKSMHTNLFTHRAACSVNSLPALAASAT